MDLQEISIVGDLWGSLWTNEKHVNYLNWMEDSFVRTLLENGCSKLTYASSSSTTTDDVDDDDDDLLLAPLDRYLPDSSDSTRDLKHQKNTSSKITYPATEISVKKKKMKKTTTCCSSQPQDAVSKDQVVPQLANVPGDGNGIMERDTLDVEVEVEFAVAEKEEKEEEEEGGVAEKEQTTNHHCNDEGRIKKILI